MPKLVDLRYPRLMHGYVCCQNRKYFAITGRDPFAAIAFTRNGNLCSFYRACYGHQLSPRENLVNS